MADNYFKRMKAYREWREAGHGEKVIYSPSAYPKEDIKKKYDELSKPTESEKMQNELEPIVHPAFDNKGSKVKTLEEEKEELELSMKSSRHQEYVRKEMDKIRKEGKIKDLYEIIREAERRVKNE